MSLEAHLFLALLEGTVGALVLALTALGLSLVFGVMRIVNIAHGSFYMLGAYVASTIIARMSRNSCRLGGGNTARSRESVATAPGSASRRPFQP